jgi:5-methylcytosine-specific restriction protein A
MNWIISANSSIYDHSSSFEHFGFIDWRQGNGKFRINDIVYIYCTKPLQKIQYKCRIQKIDLDFKNIRNDKEYWLDKSEYEKSQSGKFMRLELIEQIYSSRMSLENLLLNGLNAAPQGPIKPTEDLIKYIESNFNDSNQSDIYPDMVNEDVNASEGIKKQITVNKYERSSIARSRCIEHHGTSCQICKLDFVKRYGEIGKGFIHVHHVIPIHKIGKEYKVNYKEDLIPVCPNCHAMLHRKIDGKEITIEELKVIFESRIN